MPSAEHETPIALAKLDPGLVAWLLANVFQVKVPDYAICHGEVDAAFPALVAALRAIGPENAILYYDVVLAGLPAAARIRWEAFMTTTADYEYRSELFRQLAAKHEAEGEARGEARGKAEGEARAVLTVLEGRGLSVPTTIRDRILACTDLAQLDTWLRRAITAKTIEDVIEG